MGWTGHGQIGCKFKGSRFNSSDKTDSKGSNINTDFIDYVTKTFVKKEARKIKHVDTVVNSIQPFPLAVAKALPNTHKNPRTPVGCYRTNSLKYSYAYLDFVSDKISHSCERATSYTTN